MKAKPILCPERLRRLPRQFSWIDQRLIRDGQLENGRALSHPLGEKALFHPRYLKFAAHYGFEPRACNMRKANEKRSVETAVAYVKKNFLAGLELAGSLAALNRCAPLDGSNCQPPYPWRGKEAAIDLFCGSCRRFIESQGFSQRSELGGQTSETLCGLCGLCARPF